ncbi:hypothetical protein PTKIN_Ptkin01aG0362200 [Pterospermum kingtungense]
MAENETAEAGEITELKKKLQRVVENMLEEDDYGIEKTTEALKNLSSLAALKLKKPLLGLDETVLLEKCKCPISGEIMSDPVVLASGQTYDRPQIQNWLEEGNLTCPQSKQVLSNSVPIPNCLVRELISDWCKKHGIALPTPYQDINGETSTKLDRIYLHSLLEKLSSSSLSDQKEAAQELRRLTKTAPSCRAVLCEFTDAISKLLSPLSESKVEEDTDLQENLVTTVLNLSTHDGKTKRLIAETPRAITLLVESVKFGTIETRSNAAAALFSLSTLKSNKCMIGNSGAPGALLDLLREGHPSAIKDTAEAILSLCIAPVNREKFIEIRAVREIVLKIHTGILTDQLLAILALLSTHPNAITELAELDTMRRLLQIIRDSTSERTKENSVTVLYHMCSRDRTLLLMLGPEENEMRILAELADTGNPRARRKAGDIIKELHKAFPAKR